MGERRAPDYPFAPDSTIAHWTLPRALAPGDSLVAEIEWRARPPTPPRRQGRQRRRFDSAQWDPKVAVSDRHGAENNPLYPPRECYRAVAPIQPTIDSPA